MVTKEQAQSTREFHYAAVCNGTAPYPIGTSASRRKVETWRANGKCKVWVTRPNEFQLPIKFGMYSYSYLTHENAHEFHTAGNCPNNAQTEAQS